MVFDDSLSETVSLSKVLDQLIADEENPNIVILTFLQQHEDDFKDLIKDSLYWQRIFQLDFLFKCNSENQEWLLRKLKSIPAKYAAFFCWQICKTESLVADKLKYKFKQEFSWILKMFNTRHPYSTRLGKTTENFDRLLHVASKNDTIGETIDSWNIVEFKRFLGVSAYSLFKYRIFQYDVFSKLDAAKQFLILKKIQDETITPLIDPDFPLIFLKQLLSTDESSELKFEVLKAYVNCYKWQYNSYVSWQNIKEDKQTLVDECEGSYAKLKIKMMLNGIMDNTQTILELFFKHKKDILISWLEDDPKSLDDNIRVSQLVQYMKDKKLFNEY